VTVYFDPFMDQQRIYELDINAYNVQGDGVINASRQSGDGGIPVADRSWDALFYSGARIVDDGYTAEMAIPFKSLRYPQQPPGVAHRWGFQIVREIKGKNQENDVWAPMSREVQSFMAQMGVLEGMTDLSTSLNLELLPTFTAIRFEELDAASGGLSDPTTFPEAGLNLNYGITSNLTADLAINPDFSQIESDQPQIAVNQRFPLFFDELRPFFLEGSESFQFTSPIQLVHTRTIVAPRVGGKLTGKVGRTTLGLLVADDEAPGLRDDMRDSAFGETAKFFVGRARYDLYAESHIGTLFTDREFLDGYSRVGGFDTQLRINQVSRFNFVAYQSAHRDEEGVEQTGPMWGALYSRNGRNLRIRSFVGQTDPDFRTDVGFVRRVDQQWTFNNVEYRWFSEHWLIDWGPTLRYEQATTSRTYWRTRCTTRGSASDSHAASRPKPVPSVCWSGSAASIPESGAAESARSSARLGRSHSAYVPTGVTKSSSTRTTHVWGARRAWAWMRPSGRRRAYRPDSASRPPDLTMCGPAPLRCSTSRFGVD